MNDKQKKLSAVEQWAAGYHKRVLLRQAVYILLGYTSKTALRKAFDLEKLLRRMEAGVVELYLGAGQQAFRATLSGTGRRVRRQSRRKDYIIVKNVDTGRYEKISIRCPLEDMEEKKKREKKEETDRIDTVKVRAARRCTQVLHAGTYYTGACGCLRKEW